MPGKISDFLKIKKNHALYKSIKNDGSIYAFTAKDTVWSLLEDDPTFVVPTPLTDNTTLLQELEDIIALKKVDTLSVALGLRRYNWTYGSVYDPYDAYDENLLRKQFYPERNPFYVVTDEYNVYKCLVSGGFSTSKPTSQSLTPVTLADGYTWKFMYSIPESLRLRFLTAMYIPVSSNTEFITNSSQELVSLAAISGTINRVEILTEGTGYTNGNVTIEADDPTGEGSGFVCVPTFDILTGAITDISVSNPGSSYSALTTIVITGDGAAASARPHVAPLNGHGYNVAYELGAFFTLVSVELDNADTTFFPYATTFRKVGLITDHKEDLTVNQYTQDYYYGPRHPDYEDAGLRASNPELFMKLREGTILYINYISKITRALNQKETIKCALETI
jgi:hypothetical protein